jgi:hypothetical protein
MRKQIVLILSGLILISLFSGCLDESIVEIYNDHLEGCKTEYVIYEPYFDEECYSECSEELQFIQQQGCEAYCRDENNGYQDCLNQCRILENSLPIISNSEDICQEECIEASPKSITLGQSIPVPRCSSTGLAPLIFSGPVGCIDARNCPAEGNCNPEISFGCTIPNNYTCQIVDEEYQLRVYYSGEGTIYVNGVPFQTHEFDSRWIFGPYITVYFYDHPDVQISNAIIGIPSSITITADEGFDQNGFGITLERECCYECREKSIPAAILYPKVDIEGFSITGGPTIIKDGKIISAFNAVPGTQKTTIQIENRGFFTQRNAMVQFLGLPQGVTVDISPNSQKIKAHNTADYEATFTVGPNVPSGTYKVTMLAISPNGTSDTIQIDLVIP